MKVDDIHWHDSKILGVRENPANDTLAYDLEYPVDWKSNSFEKKTITFFDQMNHSISEGPFEGSPTILEVNILETNEQYGIDRTHIQIETNAGKRNLWFSRIEADI